MKKRTISALLLCALLTLSACATDTTDTSATDTTTAMSTEPAETTEARIEPDLPESDFDGYTFKVMTKGQTNVHWKSKDIATDEENGEPINDAVFMRNSKVGEKYNFTVADIPMSQYGAWANEVTTVVLAGDNAYDMFCFHVRDVINKGYLYNLYDVPYMDLDMPYYDQNIKDSLTLGDKLYAITGDMLIMDNDATICVQFNKKLADDYGIASTLGASDMYELARDGKWTLDALYETAKIVAKDLNGNGEIDFVGDQWGFQTEDGNVPYMVTGSGEFVAKIDADGFPQLALNGERVSTILELVGEIQTNNNVTLHATVANKLFPGTDVWDQCMDKNFREGRVLFNMSGMNRVTLFRTMEIDFGILPVPKYEESQDRYYCTVGGSISNYISFPSTTVEIERTGIIVEALSAESMYTLTPAYYDITLEGKAIRDDESKEMLDIIFNSTIIDIGLYFNWGSFTSVLQNFNTFASAYAAAETKALTEMEATVDAIWGF